MTCKYCNHLIEECLVLIEKNARKQKSTADIKHLYEPYGTDD